MSALISLVEEELGQPVLPEVRDFATAIAARHAPASCAVLFYGSCLWARQLDGLMLDFYLIVDDYKSAYAKAWLAKANQWIPPNVFYAEHQNLVAKYAVLSRADLARLCRAESLSVSVWARFAQPSALVWSRDEAARIDVIESVAQAAPALLQASRPLMPDEISVEHLWTQAFAATYAAELRAEKQQRGATLFEANAARYRAFTALALQDAGLDATVHADRITFLAPADTKAGARQWAKRRRHGKLMSVVRLLKASATFDGGIDYLAWKITRHAGQPIHIRPWMRRLPILGGLWLLPALLRKGAVR